jgi:hypothetical protein
MGRQVNFTLKSLAQLLNDHQPAEAGPGDDQRREDVPRKHFGLTSRTPGPGPCRMSATVWTLHTFPDSSL